MGTLGEKLRQARERSNLSLRDLSEITKIRTDHLEALENGNYEMFSAPVYIRGFVRSYAGAVKLDLAEVLSDLDRELSQTERFADDPPLMQGPKGPIDFLMLQVSRINWSVALPLLGIAFVLLIGVLGYRYYQERKTADPLRDLGPGFYELTNRGEVLPLPLSTNF